MSSCLHTQNKQRELIRRGSFLPSFYMQLLIAILLFVFGHQVGSVFSTFSSVCLAASGNHVVLVFSKFTSQFL